MAHHHMIKILGPRFPLPQTRVLSNLKLEEIQDYN